MVFIYLSALDSNSVLLSVSRFLRDLWRLIILLQIVKFIFRILILDIPLDLWLYQNTLMPQCIIRKIEMEHFCSKGSCFCFLLCSRLFFKEHIFNHSFSKIKFNSLLCPGLWKAERKIVHTTRSGRFLWAVREPKEHIP